jgi:hypothetical protein
MTDKIPNWKNLVITFTVVLAIIGMLYLILYYIPGNYENNIMSSYNNNSTLASVHITAGSNLLIAFVTFLYVLLTGALVIYSQEAIKQSQKAIEKSQEAIEQAKKEQQIRDIEHRLEKFYYPLSQRLGDYCKTRGKSIDSFMNY